MTGPSVDRPYTKKTTTFNHLQMPLQRQDVLLSHFKTLSIGPVWVWNLSPPAW